MIPESHYEPLEVTIVRSRYGGIYEPGKWIAFAMSPGDLPPDWNGDDIVCTDFFQSRRGAVGGGETPQEAYEHLLRLLQVLDKSLPHTGQRHCVTARREREVTVDVRPTRAWGYRSRATGDDGS